ncbi:MAG: DUF2442 domain-containing protein [Acidobacteria bacterium]|nr:DUF2442 domain-containing protein [Acidobacteriota bacterium]
MSLLRIANVTALPERRLRLRLTDGTTIERDASPLLLGAVFEEVRRDPEVFAQVRIIEGTVAWPNGADLCPDTLMWGGLPPSDPHARPEPSAVGQTRVRCRRRPTGPAGLGRHPQDP